MPIFVYEPILSGEEHENPEARECCFFETLQWSSEAPLTKCPECGLPIRRAVTSFALSGQPSHDPLKGVAKKLGDDINGGLSDASSSEKSESRSLISGSSSQTSAGRAARLAYRHVCSGNCRH